MGFECLEQKHLNTRIFDSRLLKSYFSDTLFSLSSDIKNLIHIQAGEGSCLDDA